MPSRHAWLCEGLNGRKLPRRGWTCWQIHAIGPTPAFQLQLTRSPRPDLDHKTAAETTSTTSSPKNIDDVQMIATGPTENNPGDTPNANKMGRDHLDTGNSPRPLSSRSNRPKACYGASTIAIFSADSVDYLLRSVSSPPSACAASAPTSSAISAGNAVIKCKRLPLTGCSNASSAACRACR